MFTDQTTRTAMLGVKLISGVGEFFGLLAKGFSEEQAASMTATAMGAIRFIMGII
jgi:hypothetical protein